MLYKASRSRSCCRLHCEILERFVMQPAMMQPTLVPPATVQPAKTPDPLSFEEVVSLVSR